MPALALAQVRQLGPEELLALRGKFRSTPVSLPVRAGSSLGLHVAFVSWNQVG